MEAAPKELSTLEIELILRLVGTGRVVDYFAGQFGAARLASILAAPSLSTWDEATQTRTISRKKGVPDGALLRNLVAKQSAKRREECKQAVLDVWSAGDVHVHQQLAFAFFEDEAWRAQALSEVLELGPPFSNQQLTLPRDAASMRTLLSRRPKGFKLTYPEIVASLGADALPILIELAKTATGNAPALLLRRRRRRSTTRSSRPFFERRRGKTLHARCRSSRSLSKRTRTRSSSPQR